MTFISTSTQLLRAIRNNNLIEVEELILNSDSRRELILEHITAHGEEYLINALPHFRSKGLALNIKALLNL